MFPWKFIQRTWKKTMTYIHSYIILWIYSHPKCKFHGDQFLRLFQRISILKRWPCWIFRHFYHQIGWLTHLFWMLVTYMCFYCFPCTQKHTTGWFICVVIAFSPDDMKKKIFAIWLQLSWSFRPFYHQIGRLSHLFWVLVTYMCI